jgi:hypothetical protein
VSLVVVSPPEDLLQAGVFELPFLASPASVRPVTQLLPEVDAVVGLIGFPPRAAGIDWANVHDPPWHGRRP